MNLTPPTTGDPAVDQFFRNLVDVMKDRVRPAEGWSLSDFAASVSEVISDKRDLIDIVSDYDDMTVIADRWRTEYENAMSEARTMLDFIENFEQHADRFVEVMEWWDQNYAFIFEAQEALNLFRDISNVRQEAIDLVEEAGSIRTSISELKEATETAAAAAEAAQTKAEEARDESKRQADLSEESAKAALRSEEAAGSSEGEAVRIQREIESFVADEAAQIEEKREEVDTKHGAVETWHGEVEVWQGNVRTHYDEINQTVADGAETIRTFVKDDADRAEAARDKAEEHRNDANEHREAAQTAATQSITAKDTSVEKAQEVDTETTAFMGALAEFNGEFQSYTETAKDQFANDLLEIAGHLATVSTTADEVEQAKVLIEAYVEQIGQIAQNAALQAAAEKLQEFLDGAPAAFDTWMEVVEGIQEGNTAIEALTQQVSEKITGPYEIAVSGQNPGAGTPSLRITFVTGA